MTNASLPHRLVRLAFALVTVALVFTTTVDAQQRATYEVVASFDSTFPGGRTPSSLRQANDGSFYGTTSNGGTFDLGTVFRMDVTGAVTSLYSFSGTTDGGGPFGLVTAPSGQWFYGLTSGAAGTVFRFTPNGVLTTVHSFVGTGGSPVDLFAASDGSVYGLTEGGGDFGNGTIFVITPGDIVQTIHSIPLSAGTSMTSLVRGSDSRFYATAELGGDAEWGTIFTIDDAGTLTILHSFAGPLQDGARPGGLMQRGDGRLYGTTSTGGQGDQGSGGTVYSIDLSGDYQILHNFSVSSGGGVQPRADLLEASDGNLYGVTHDAVFRLDSSGRLTMVRGALPQLPGELIQGADGRLYAPTALGGLDGGGTIIALDLAGTLSTLFEFTIGAGAAAVGRPNGIIQARDGQFYGTTAIPGTRTGTAFAMDAAGSVTTLHSFHQNFSSPNFFSDGTPNSRLFEGADGSLYGTTFNDFEPFVPPGQVFKIGPAGDFTTVTTEWRMRGGVIQARDGRLYFTTSIGESGSAPPGFGQIFRVEPDGTGRTLLHRFDGIERTSEPSGGLVEIDNGMLYGTTHVRGLEHGTIFQIDPLTGTFTTRYRFNGPDGSRPTRLMQGADGLIYGTTGFGGAYGRGTVFSFDSAGTLTTLHHFSGADGENPGSVIQGADGRLYGTTISGGAFGHGTVFALNVTGGLTTVHDFASSDGAGGGLIQANDGAFYGTALGGPRGGGVIFRVRLPTSPPDQYVEIVSRHSGQCLDVVGASTDAAAPAIQWTCHGGPNQQWRLEPAGGGAFRIVARHSGQVLDVSRGSVDDVAPIIQWPVHGGENQVWTLEPASDGYMRIVARHSGKAMDVEFASADEGARVIQYTPHGGANQQWLLRPVE